MDNHHSNVADYTLIMVADRERSLGVKQTEDGEVVWLPKSLVEYEVKKGRVVEVTIPDWLAEREGLA